MTAEGGQAARRLAENRGPGLGALEELDMTKPTQDQIDRACEWIAEHCPDLKTIAEHEAKMTEVLADLAAIDAAADAADGASS